jgi:hypothetical protein
MLHLHLQLCACRWAWAGRGERMDARIFFKINLGDSTELFERT